MISKNFKYNLSFYKNIVRNISFYKRKKPTNHYETLGVSFDSDYETIKKAYYVLAKKYHPDLNPTEEALENFKSMKKAYEVLGDPNLRIAYDLENKFNDGNEMGRSESNSRYTSRYGKRVMSGPRTIKNFYYDQWSNYKTPDWSDLKHGMDSKTEYILRDLDDELAVSQRTNQVYKLLLKYRILIASLLFFSLDIFFVLKNRHLYKSYVMYKSAFFK